MTFEKKIRLLFWMTGISLFLSILAVIFSIVHIDPFTITEATYIGVIVSSMGIIFAIFVGYQIYNAIEVTKELQGIIKQKKGLETSIEQLSNSQKIAEAYNFSNRGWFAISIEQYENAILLFLKSLKIFLLSDNLIVYMSDIEGIIGNIGHCIFKIKKSGTMKNEHIVNLFVEIKNIPNYVYLSENFKSKLHEIEK